MLRIGSDADGHRDRTHVGRKRLPIGGVTAVTPRGRQPRGELDREREQAAEGGAQAPEPSDPGSGSGRVYHQAQTTKSAWNGNRTQFASELPVPG